MKMSKWLKNKTKQITLILIIISLISTFIVEVKAKDTTKDYSKCTNASVSKELNPSYDYVMDNNIAKATLTVAKGELLVKKIDEGVYDENTDNYTQNSSITHVSDVSKYLGKTVTKDSSKNPVIVIKQAKASEQSTYIRVTLVLKESSDNCDSAEEYEKKTGQKISDASQTKAKEIAATAVLEVFIPVPKEGSMQIEDNENYYTDYCRLMRAGSKEEAQNIAKEINTKVKTEEKVDVTSVGLFDPAYRYENYSKYLPGCFNQGPVSVNYTSERLAKLISNVIKSTDSLKKAKPAKSSTLFDQGYTIEQIKEKASTQQNDSNQSPSSIKNKHIYEFGKMPENINVANELKCEYRSSIIKDISELNSRDDKNQYRYTNNEYFYAISVDTINADYKYDYDGISDEAHPDVCKKTCEEGLIVSYGPPQAVAAGFCFEYQIKVVSKVKCTIELYDAAPTLEGYCTPVPQCEHVKIGTLTQAGPSEEYDACISACDGGKYTQSCSKSCYNKVYGKKGNVNETALTFNGIAKQMANVESNGYYVREGGAIVWKNNGAPTFARWYAEEDKKAYHTAGGDFYADKDGFKRKHYNKSDTDCDGKCHNSGCDGKVYLNPSSAQRDYEFNMGQYEKALNQCSAGATCSTKTSTYNIEVTNYSQYNEGRLESNKQFNSQTTVADKDQSILIDGNGCYNNNAQDYYAAEWSFPGTWVNNKTGEISFTPKSNGWHRVTNKFCLPLDTKATNSDWWNWYMKKAQGTVSNEKGTGSYKTNEYNDKCTAISKAASNPSISDWNIKGSTKDFGFFKWNIKIACFYATQSNQPSTPPECEAPTLNGYTTRTIDNQNLFPATENSNSSSNSNTGRTPGYNWTKSATISVENGKSNPNYQIDPTVLIAKIQKLKDGVYNDSLGGTEEYLDYELSLSPEQINSIKRDIKLKAISYETWDNENSNASMYNKDTKMILYKSKFLSNTKYVTIVNNRRGLIGCNNQKKQGECDVLLGN